MGQQRVYALLPWIVFAVVDRYGGQGVTWASIGALVTAVTLLVTERDNGSGVPNVLMIGAVILFAGLTVAGFIYDTPHSWLAHNGRALAALGLAAIAMASLTYIPITEHYSRPHTRPSLWRTERFHRVNVYATMMWAGIAALAALSHIAANLVNQPSAYTVLNWVVPIAMVAIGAHRANLLWERSFDDESELALNRDPLWELTLEMGAGHPAADDF
jgi:hypothetical protein